MRRLSDSVRLNRCDVRPARTFGFTRLPDSKAEAATRSRGFCAFMLRDPATTLQAHRASTPSHRAYKRGTRIMNRRGERCPHGRVAQQMFDFRRLPCERCHAHSSRLRPFRGVAADQQLLPRRETRSRRDHRHGAAPHAATAPADAGACGGAQGSGLQRGRTRPDGRADRAVSRSAAGAGADGIDVSGRCRRSGGVGESASRRQGRRRREAGGQPTVGSQRAVAGGVPAGAGDARPGSGVGATPRRCVPGPARRRDGRGPAPAPSRRRRRATWSPTNTRR